MGRMMGWGERIACVICGDDTYRAEKMTPYRSGFVCPSDVDSFTQEELDRAGHPEFKPPVRARAGSRLPNVVDEHRLSEQALFNLVCADYGGGVYEYRYVQVVEGDGAALTTNRWPRTAGWAGIYLYGVISEARRPKIWIDRAKVRLREIADFLITMQRGSGQEHADIAAALSGAAAASATTTDYGGFVDLTSELTVLGVKIHQGSIWSEDLGVCGLALLRAYQVFGDAKYRVAYRRALTCLRRMQQTGKLTADFTASDSGATARLNTGMWQHRLVYVETVLYSEHDFYPGDLCALEFLEAAKAAEGDLAYGDTSAVGDYGSATSAALSTMISEAKAFWTDGIQQQGTGAAVKGFSAATPREYFDAYPGFSSSGFGAAGTGQWKYSDGLSEVTGRNYALGVRGLYASGGYADVAKSVWDWLMTGTSNTTYQMTATNSLGQDDQRVLFAGQLGNYDPALALATEIVAATAKNGSSLYEWSTVGLMAKLQSAQARGKFKAAKSAMSQPRPRAYVGAGSNRSFVPYIRGRTGLSYQMDSEGVIDISAACMAALAYREAPVIFGENDN